MLAFFSQIEKNGGMSTQGESVAANEFAIAIGQPNQSPPDEAMISLVKRMGDWVAYGLYVGTQLEERPGDAIWAPVFARFEDERLAEWTTDPPPCFQ